MLFNQIGKNGIMLLITLINFDLINSRDEIVAFIGERFFKFVVTINVSYDLTS